LDKEPKRELFGEVATDGWEHDVWLMARRLSLLYHYLATAIVERLGDEEGRALVKTAVWNYGTHIGNVQKEAAIGMGLPLTKENFRRVPDLPSRGWRHRDVTLTNGKNQRQTYLCPIARAFKDISTDPNLTSLHRLYCFVDQSKVDAYNGCDLECVHEHNVLSGDDFCEVVTREKAK